VLNTKIKNGMFGTILAVTGLVSLIDLYLAVKWGEYLYHYEKNPIVLKMMEISGDLSIFVVAKVVGTLLALFLMKKIYDRSSKWGFSVGVPILLFQLSLLYYLFLG
tara:strand:+ start:717 stop:1034 length:318 start_codon:yes stop_codon:yes gene_type:complete